MRTCRPTGPKNVGDAWAHAPRDGSVASPLDTHAFPTCYRAEFVRYR